MFWNQKETIELMKSEMRDYFALQDRNTAALVEIITKLQAKVDDLQDVIHTHIELHGEETASIIEEVRQVRTNQTAVNKDMAYLADRITDFDVHIQTQHTNLYQELLKISTEQNSLLDYAEFDTVMQEFEKHVEELAAKIEELFTRFPSQTVFPYNYNTTASLPFGSTLTTGTTFPPVYNFPGMSAEAVEEIKQNIEKEVKKSTKRTPRKHTLAGDAEVVKNMQDALDTFGETEASQGQD